MTIIHLSNVAADEPSASDLVAIEREWPLIEAERDLLDAEIALLNAGRDASPLDHRRVRRAERRVQKVGRELANLAPSAEIVA